jgi:hypothetical protein
MAMSTSLEVAYAASRLARHNSKLGASHRKLGASHHKVADRVTPLPEEDEAMRSRIRR